MNAPFSMSTDLQHARRAAQERQLKAAIKECALRLKQARKRASQRDARPGDLQNYQGLQVQLSSLERQLKRLQAGVYDQ